MLSDQTKKIVLSKLVYGNFDHFVKLEENEDCFRDLATFNRLYALVIVHSS